MPCPEFFLLRCPGPSFAGHLFKAMPEYCRVSLNYIRVSAIIIYSAGYLFLIEHRLSPGGMNEKKRT